MPTPQSNVEKFLSVIAGHSTEVPGEPTSRAEWYLNEIVKNGGIGGKLKPKPVSELPATGEPGILYLVSIQGTSGQNTHDEYFWVEEESKYELLGQAKIEIDLSEYALKSEIPTVPTNISAFENDSGYLTDHQDISGKVDKVTGKGLSTNDFTDALKDKLSGVDPGATATVIDATLSNSDEAADAKATGDALDVLRTENALLRELLQGVDAPIYRDASGNPATFTDGAAANVKSLSVEITPTQSGSGAPYPPGVGKNKANVADFTLIRQSNRTKTASVSVPAGAYTFSMTVSANSTTKVGMICSFSNDPDYEFAIVSNGNAGRFSFTRTFNSELTRLYFYIPASDPDGASVTISQFQLESGQTATDYAPYSNVRPISGTTSVTVTRAGKNLLPITAQSAAVNGVTFTVNRDAGGNVVSVTANGTNTGNAAAVFTAAIHLLPADGSYILSGCTGGAQNTAYWHRYYYSEQYAVNGTGGDAPFSYRAIDNPSGRYQILVAPGCTVSNVVFYPMIRRADEPDASFEPYQGQSVTVSLVDSNGDPLTVYGGMLNVTTGELTVTYKMLALNTRDMGANADYPGWANVAGLEGTAVDTLDINGVAPDGMCNIYPLIRANTLGTNRMLLWRANEIGTPLDELKAMALDVQILLPLLSPAAYQLTPAQLATLSGYNAVSADAGSVTVEYQSGYGGAKALTFTDIAASSPVGEQHRMIFGGRNLGSAVTAAQIAAVRDGSFSGLLTGDYWTINGVTWRIADMDYWYACGDTAFNRHHLVIMPDSSLTDAPMNDTNTTAGGYTGSKMYTDTLPTVKTTCAAAFPDMILTRRDYLVSAVTNGKPSAGAWADSDVELPSEIMLYGSRVISPANDGDSLAHFYTVNKSQLALFNLAPRFIRASAWFWLRDPVSAEFFALMSSNGYATCARASSNSGVRPVFAIG